MNTNYFEALPIKELAKRLRINDEVKLKKKIPEKFKLQIGRSVRYDLMGVVEYFRTKEDKHNELVENLLK